MAAFALLASSGRVAAQAPATSLPAPSDSSRPWEIEDNSFLVEEAFNQEAGVVQTIFGGLFFQQSGWALSFTQEWPAPGIKHQLSVSIPVNGLKLADGERGPDGLGDIALNYRYQLMEEGPGKPAIAPRLTVLTPTGNQGRGLGVGAWGWQMNLPVSKQHRDFYFHGNVGMTWYPRVTTGTDAASGSAPDVTLVSPTIAGSTIYRLRPMLNLMLVHQAHSDEKMSAQGNVLSEPRIVRRSGNPWYDESVVRGITKASPLPPPPHAGEWDFVFLPNED